VSTRDEILLEIGISPVWRRNFEDQTQLDSGRSVNDIAISAGEIESGVLFKSDAYTIVGKGDIEASWLFIAEEPSPKGDELANGLFLGDMSILLDNMLSAMHLARDREVFLIDVLQAHSPSEDALSVEGAVSCAEFLEQQIRLIQPSIIVAMGSAAAKRFMDDDNLRERRQKVHNYCGFDLVVTDHPLDLLKDSSGKVHAWRDLCFALEVMKAHQSPRKDTGSDEK
jgi:DNA polymerase